MLTHLIRLIWNKKKQNFLLLLEIFFSFIGLFAGITFVLYPYNNYKLPTGFDYENLWAVNFDNATEIKNIDSLQVFRESAKKVLLSMNGVEDVTYCSNNIPFSGNSSNTGITYNGAQSWANIYSTEDNYAKIMGLQLLEGRWFSSNDQAAKDRPAVISEGLKKKLFGDENALGKIVSTDAKDRMKVVGVVRDIKVESENEMPAPGIYRRMDTIDLRSINSMLVKVKQGANAAMESTVYKALSNTMKNANIEIGHVLDMRTAKNKAMRVPFIVFCIIAGFLITNVALGIFGVLWFNIHKRKGEIGLRRAVGATGKAISWQLVSEAILLATLSLILGVLFAIQFPLLMTFDLPPNNYFTAIILSALIIYVLVIICALYPGKQAAAIYPAVALHED